MTKMALPLSSARSGGRQGVGKPQSRPFTSHTHGTRIPGQCTCTGRGGAWKSPQATNTGWVGKPAARWTTARNEELGQARQESQTCGKEEKLTLRSNTSTTGPRRRAGTMTICTGLQVCLPSRTCTKLLTYHVCTFLQSRCTSPKRFI